jgi:fluoride exporter
MRLILLVGTGSFIGGICRYLLSFLIQSKTTSGFPYGTLVVNLAGCLLIGILYGVFEKTDVSTGWRLFMVTGILGGFTTFSAFSLETFHLLKSGHAVSGLLYILLSIAGGIGLTFLGAWIIRTTIPAGI